MPCTDQQIALNCAVFTISDTRNSSTDTSGGFLKEALQQAGHHLSDYTICVDNIYKIRRQLSYWIADDTIDCIITTGGTGFTSRDFTPESVTPLLDRTIDGFGEMFRYFSLKEIGTSTVQSRALGGIANQTLIFCLPGSTGACKTGWNCILNEQLDSRHSPCNFVPHCSAWHRQ